MFGGYDCMFKKFIKDKGSKNKFQNIIVLVIVFNIDYF